MGIFDFLKKEPVQSLKPISPPIAPLSSLDEKIGKLPVLPTPDKSLPQPLPPLFKTLPSAPNQIKMPELIKTEFPKPFFDLPKSEVKPPLPSLPKFSEFPTISAPKPITLSEKPPLPKFELPTQPLFSEKPPLPKFELPKLAEKVVLPPELPKQDLPRSVQPQNIVPSEAPATLAKLQDLLAELTVEEFEPVKPAPFVTHDSTKKHGPIFVAVSPYEEIIIELKTISQQFGTLQAHNEKLGIIETNTKTALEGLIGGFDTIHKQLLLIDEKLFKVN